MWQNKLILISWQVCKESQWCGVVWSVVSCSTFLIGIFCFFLDSCSSLRSLRDSQGSMAPKDIMTNSHAKSILNAMNSLRKSNTLCDITLRVENTDFPAHRIVLAACSDYFCAMFTSEVTVFTVCPPEKCVQLCVWCTVSCKAIYPSCCFSYCVALQPVFWIDTF